MSGEGAKALRYVQIRSAGRMDVEDLLQGEAILHDGFVARWRYVFGSRWGRLILTPTRLLYRDGHFWFTKQHTIAYPLATVRRVDIRAGTWRRYPRLVVTTAMGETWRFSTVRNEELEPWFRATIHAARVTPRRMGRGGASSTRSP